MAAPPGALPALGGVLPPKPPTRLKFVHDGRTIYEWEQTMDEVHMYLQPPPGVRAAQIECGARLK